MVAKLRGALLLGAVLAAAGLVSCGSGPRATSFDPRVAEAEIRKIEHDWAQVAVSGDPAVIEEIFGDDFLGVSPDGMPYTKRQFVDDTKAHPLGFTSNELNDVKVRFYGDVAVAQGDETFSRADGGRARFVWTDVLVRRENRWRIVAAQDAVAPVATDTTNAALFTGGASAPDAVQSIAKTREAYAAAWRAGDAAAIAALYTADAHVLYPDRVGISGRQAILAYFRGFFGDFPKNAFELRSAEVVVNGDWAFDRGVYRWRGTPAAGGAPEADDGKYLVVLHRESDGAWRVARDMDNSDHPRAQGTRGAN